MRVVASNTAAHRLFNLSREKLNAQRLTELTRNPAIYSAFLDALQGTERSGVKVHTYGPERLVFDLRVVPLGSAASSNGKGGEGAQGALGVFIDVTRIERLEQIRQEFLSNVSHELRTPLTAILAFVETLETGALDDRESSQRFLSIIRRNATRMQDLIDDILELSAIEAGNVQVRAEQVELYSIVSDVISSLAAKRSAQDIVVTNAVPREARVYADARRLEQMLTNLVENAIKFNRANGLVTIRYESGSAVYEESSSGGRPSAVVRRTDSILVEDTGEGIPAQHLERLFERFYRVDRARSREMGGTGLGLAIVKHLARAHGGEVTVTLPGGVPPNPEHPYVVVVADPQGAVHETDKTNNTASFRTHVIGIITHGGVQPKDRGPVRARQNYAGLGLGGGQGGGQAGEQGGPQSRAARGDSGVRAGPDLRPDLRLRPPRRSSCGASPRSAGSRCGRTPYRRSCAGSRT